METHAIDHSLASEKEHEKHKEHCFTFFVDDRPNGPLAPVLPAPAALFFVATEFQL